MRNLSRWPRVYQDQLVEPQTDPPLDDFAETISADIESTRRQMRALPDPGYTRAQRELEQLRQALIDKLTKEVEECRHQLAQLVQSTNRKASKEALKTAAAEIAARMDKRLDTIRNWTATVIAIGTLTFAILRKGG